MVLDTRALSTTATWPASTATWAPYAPMAGPVPCSAISGSAASKSPSAPAGFTWSAGGLAPSTHARVFPSEESPAPAALEGSAHVVVPAAKPAGPAFTTVQLVPIA